MLMTRPGEATRLRVIVGMGLKTPTGLITEGAHDSSIARYTYAPDNDGDETVTGASVLDDLHATSANVKLIAEVTHGKLMTDHQFLDYFLGELSHEPVIGRQTQSVSVTPPTPSPSAPVRVVPGGTVP
jgi:hypothetical protein